MQGSSGYGQSHACGNLISDGQNQASGYLDSHGQEQAYGGGSSHGQDQECTGRSIDGQNQTDGTMTSHSHVGDHWILPPGLSDHSGNPTVFEPADTIAQDPHAYVQQYTNDAGFTNQDSSDSAQPNTDDTYSTLQDLSDYAQPNTNDAYSTVLNLSDYAQPNTNGAYSTAQDCQDLDIFNQPHANGACSGASVPSMSGSLLQQRQQSSLPQCDVGLGQDPNRIAFHSESSFQGPSVSSLPRNFPNGSVLNPVTPSVRANSNRAPISQPWPPTQCAPGLLFQAGSGGNGQRLPSGPYGRTRASLPGHDFSQDRVNPFSTPVSSLDETFAYPRRWPTRPTRIPTDDPSLDSTSAAIKRYHVFRADPFTWPVDYVLFALASPHSIDLHLGIDLQLGVSGHVVSLPSHEDLRKIILHYNIDGYNLLLCMGPIAMRHCGITEPAYLQTLGAFIAIFRRRSSEYLAYCYYLAHPPNFAPRQPINAAAMKWKLASELPAYVDDAKRAMERVKIEEGRAYVCHYPIGSIECRQGEYGQLHYTLLNGDI